MQIRTDHNWDLGYVNSFALNRLVYKLVERNILIILRETGESMKRVKELKGPFPNHLLCF